MKQTWLTKLCINLFGKNYWGWAHLTTSAILCSVWFRLFPHHWTWQSIKFGFNIMLFSALFWEIIEYVFEIALKGKKVSDIYGSVSRYWQDTIGDILLAIFGWGIALI